MGGIVVSKRLLLVVLMFLLSVLLYVDRICISIAESHIKDSLQFTEKQIGWIFSAFALGYALFQTPAGALADRFGPRIVLSSVVILWSIFTGLTAAAFNYITMLTVRFLFGAGEAGAFPNMSRAIYSWIPMDERGRVQGINFSGSRIGAAFAFPALAWLITVLGWRLTFAVLTAIGIVWALFFYAWFRNDPTEHPTISSDELDYILRHRQQADAGALVQPLSMRTLFGSMNMWLAMIQYFSSNFTFFFCLSWLFPYLKTKYDLGPVEAGFYTACTMLAGAAGNWFSGWMVDAIYRRGYWELSRKLTAMIGFLLAAAGLVVSVYMESPQLSILFFSIAIFGADMTLSPSWTLCVDIGRTHSGMVSGTMNMAGNLGSFVTALAFPYLKDWTGSAVPFFFVGAGLNIMAIFVWLAIQPKRTLEDNG